MCAKSEELIKVGFKIPLLNQQKSASECFEKCWTFMC